MEGWGEQHCSAVDAETVGFGEGSVSVLNPCIHTDVIGSIYGTLAMGQAQVSYFKNPDSYPVRVLVSDW